VAVNATISIQPTHVGRFLLEHIFRGHPASPEVLSARHRLKVGRVDALTDPAYVI
jgi:hypothetical protein